MKKQIILHFSFVSLHHLKVNNFKFARRGFCPSKLKAEDEISQTRVYLDPEDHDRELRREEELRKMTEEIEKDFKNNFEKIKSNKKFQR